MVNPEALLITNEYVRVALDQMIQATPTNIASSLQFLHLIDLHMLRYDFSFFQEPRQFALNDLLVSTIHTQYVHQRSLHDFSPVEMGLSLLNATKFIIEDASTGNSDLIGWSWLYYRYVEMSLRITQQQFCQMVNLDDRTIRRYQSSTIEQLAKHLIRMEQNARENRRKQVLYFQLPHQGTISDLIEREKELHLVRKSKLKHFYVVGAAGIGKTVFVEQTLKEQIDNDEFDHIVWIHSPETVENVRSYLHERLLGEDSKITLVEYTSLRKTTIVIDNAEKLQDDLLELQSFLQEFSNATIFMTSRMFHPLPHCLQVDLHELSLSAVQTMVSIRKINRDMSLEIGDYVRLLWQSVGGNPLAVELLVHNWSIFELQSATLLTLDQLFAQLFDSMPITQHLAWLILAFLIDESVVLSSLSEINFLNVTFADFVTLGRLCIAKTSSSENSHITITVSACRYIQMRYKASFELQRLLDQFVAQIILIGSNISTLNLTLIESALSVDWVALSTDSYLEAVRQFWKQGLRGGYYTKWYIILGRLINELTPQNLDLAIGYGISQRCLGQWSQAHSVFTAVAQYAGMQGMFSYQAEALLELAIQLRYQGNYAGAVATLDHIDNFPDATTAELRYRVIIERIEVALERNDLADAKSLFANLHDDEIRRLILQLEIFARDTSDGNELPFLASLSDKLLFDFGYSPSLTARMHILIGRIYQKVTDIKAATKHLTIALSVLMDIDNDPFALARTQSNLAALLMTSDQLLDAQELLKSAENIQRKIGDRVGLAVTMHNEHVLDRKIVN